MWQNVVERFKSLTMEQRIAMAVLGICGILAMGLSVYHLENTIRSPFLVDKSVIADAKKIIGETDSEKIAREKRMDTDGDGLADWDESNIYHTNPNLRDSCGDGYADNIRVLTGKNLGCVNSPNQGGNLDYSMIAASSSDLFVTPDGTNLLDGPLQDASSSVGLVPVGDVSPQAAGVLARDPVTIRQALIESGKIDLNEINQLTDQQLLEIYDRAIEEDTQSVNPNAVSQPFLGVPQVTTTQK